MRRCNDEEEKEIEPEVLGHHRILLDLDLCSFLFAYTITARS